MRVSEVLTVALETSRGTVPDAAAALWDSHLCIFLHVSTWHVMERDGVGVPRLDRTDLIQIAVASKDDFTGQMFHEMISLGAHLALAETSENLVVPMVHPPQSPCNHGFTGS
ncbi:hypothetical protein SAY86_024138 [Trapa natans]|uniref:Uncharacterized protein n=1 Tax=Trapa natans TaxID=22666 RepID=A0AAN7MA43_TRANT|nr:hypothetical protein SAY86_024138 [Trapa natans]